MIETRDIYTTDNGNYKGKYDPRLVWGQDYWKCCFMKEVQRGLAELQELSEHELFDVPPNKQPTYTVCVVGAKRDTLYTFASRVPAPAWAERADALREAAASFDLL